jgi:hypothetical protein
MNPRSIPIDRRIQQTAPPDAIMLVTLDLRTTALSPLRPRRVPVRVT